VKGLKDSPQTSRVLEKKDQGSKQIFKLVVNPHNPKLYSFFQHIGNP
jgi:hypothetical protein